MRAAITQLEGLILDCERRIAEMFRIYDEVFEALTAQRTPEPFRRFLIDGPRLFARLGERMGRLEQLTSYWGHQFPGLRTRQLRPEAIYDGLRNLLSALSLGGPPGEGRGGRQRNASGVPKTWRPGRSPTGGGARRRAS